MRKLSINVPDAVASQLDVWASQEGRPVSHLCNYLLEKGVAEAEAVGVLAPRIPTTSDPVGGIPARGEGTNNISNGKFKPEQH